MSKFSNKTTTIRIKVHKNTFSLYCDTCETLNYIGGTSDALGCHIYKIMVETLRSMNENNCKVIKISASWE